MRIEQVKTAPDRMGRHWVTLEDGTRMGLYRQTVEDFSLYTGRDLTPEELERLKTAAGAMSAKMRSVRIVSMSSVSCRDLESRLIRKGEDPQQAHAAVEWMEELGLMDDLETARNVVRSCIGKGYGLARARQALFEKKIPREYWQEALADYPDQQDKIESFLRTRLGDDPDPKQIKRAVDALLRRGHSYGAIRRALQNRALETEDFLED